MRQVDPMVDDGARGGEQRGDEDGKAPQAMHPSFARVLAQRQEVKAALAGVKHRIGVYSAKGGVGKTTVAVNLAYALRGMGLRVGLLDADVDTPNVALFLGMTGVREAVYPLRPVDKDGVMVLSTAMFVDESMKPIIWRGPMIGKMIGEFLGKTEWGELDYLVLDLGPGTSDAALSIMQLLEMDGFVLVTTPQHTAAINAIRSGRMIKRMGISILGVVENMSEGEVRGAAEVARELGCDVLGAIGRDNKFSALSDSGVVPVLADKGAMMTFSGIASRFVR